MYLNAQRCKTFNNKNVCNDGKFYRIWNRDINAALNILILCRLALECKHRLTVFEIPLSDEWNSIF